MLTLKVLLEVPSWNEFVGRSHWVLTKEKKRWFEAIGMAKIIARAGGHISSTLVLPPQVKRKATVTAYRKRRIDSDNICLKPVMDALVRNDFIHDDSLKWCDLHVAQELCPKGETPYTLIEIENLPEGMR